MPKDVINMDIDQITQLTVDDLADIEICAGLGERVLEIERTNRFEEATKLFNFLQNFLEANKDFETDHPKLAKKYQTLIIWLKFIALHVVLDEDLYALFKDHLLEGIRLDLGLRERIRTLFRFSWDPFLRGEKRDMILRAFSDNNERLGNYKFTLGTKERVVPATVSNLILDYNRLAKSDEKRGGLEEVHYLDHSPNIRQLSQRERDLTLKILQIYDFVRFPPLEEMAREMVISPIRTTEAAATPLPKRGLPQAPLAPPLARVEREEEKPQAAALDPMELLKQKYQNYRAQRQGVLKIEDEILVQTKGEVEGVKKELAHASRQNDKNRVIACLKILARQKALINSLRDNPAWFEATASYIQKKYASQYKPEEVKQAISNLKLDPTTTAALSEFLQYLLKEKLALTENDSALVGVEIGQFLGNQYQSLAYGNQETGSFEWIKNKIVNSRLVSEVE